MHKFYFEKIAFLAKYCKNLSISEKVLIAGFFVHLHPLQFCVLVLSMCLTSTFIFWGAGGLIFIDFFGIFNIYDTFRRKDLIGNPSKYKIEQQKRTCRVLQCWSEEIRFLFGENFDSVGSEPVKVPFARAGGLLTCSYFIFKKKWSFTGVAWRRKVWGTNFFPEKWEAIRKKGHSSIKAQDSVLWMGGGAYNTAKRYTKSNPSFLVAVQRKR